MHVCACSLSSTHSPKRSRQAASESQDPAGGATSQLSPEQPVTAQESDTILLSHRYGQ